MVNSGFLDGMSVEESKKAITQWLVEKGIGEAKTNFKLRDWVFSRQRYWGEPIPMVSVSYTHLDVYKRQVACIVIVAVF